VKLLLNKFNALDTDNDGLIPINLVVNIIQEYDPSYDFNTIRFILDKYGILNNSHYKF
jgi:Ca2+-binding EF-hand superfamily protein